MLSKLSALKITVVSVFRLLSVHHIFIDCLHLSMLLCSLHIIVTVLGCNHFIVALATN